MLPVGPADLARLFARRVGASGQVVLTDINASMLARGRDRLADAGLVLPSVLCDAQALPFRSGHFDCVCIGFGLRNVTRKDEALQEMTRVLRPGGRVLVWSSRRCGHPSGRYTMPIRFKFCPGSGGW